MPPSRAWTTHLFPEKGSVLSSGWRRGGGGRKDAECCASDDERVRSRWHGVGLSTAPTPSIVLGREQTRTHDTLANERAVRGHSREGIEGLSGLLFRERRSVQQGGEERIEIAGAGELKG